MRFTRFFKIGLVHLTRKTNGSLPLYFWVRMEFWERVQRLDRHYGLCPTSLRASKPRAPPRAKIGIKEEEAPPLSYAFAPPRPAHPRDHGAPA